MSSFEIKALHKATGEIHSVWCMDNYFGHHKYGYIPNIDGGKALSEKEFYQVYARTEPCR